jgi:hypothetical protein
MDRSHMFGKYLGITMQKNLLSGRYFSLKLLQVP